MTAAVSSVLALYQPEAKPQQVAVLVSLVAGRGYSKAELRYALEELAFDEDMNNKLRYKSPVTPADFERVIKASRQYRAMLDTPQPEREMLKICSKFPEVKRENWHKCGFDEFNNPLYRYVEVVAA